MYTSIAAAILLVASSFVSAQSTRPALHDLQRETQNLYREVQQSIVHVHVPVQVIMHVIGQEHPLQKWGPQLDPKVREQLERELLQQQQQRATSGTVQVNNEQLMPPTSQPVQLTPQSPAPGPGAVIVTPSPVTGDFVGIILGQGFVLLPAFVDKSVLGNLAVRVTYDDRQETTATLVGGDLLSNIALFRMAQPLGAPIKLTDDPPEAGSLVLVIAPVRRNAHLSLWSGGQEENGILINSVGAVAGFARNGHLLEPKAFRPIVEELLQKGTVRRSLLGVAVRELPPDDPSRIQNKLGDRPAAQVVQVLENSAAAKAGVLPGDLVLTLGDQPVNDLPHFAAAMVNRTGPTDLKILRNGTEQSLKVVLELK